MAGHSHWAGIKHKKADKIKKEQNFFQNCPEKLQLPQNLARLIPRAILD